MTERPLKVLVVSEDRPMLRHITQFLTVFGYDPRQAADVQQARAAVDSDRPEFLLVDFDLAAQDGLPLCRAVKAEDGREYLYTLLLVGSAESRQLTEALEAGVDDFLAKPLVHGEMLVRLRAGARALEYERRLRQQSATDPRTGLPGRSELRARLGRELNRAADSARPPACVVMDVDYFRRVNIGYGQPTGDRVLKAVADQLKDQCGAGEFFCCLGGTRFAALLPETSDTEAAEWAEQLRATLEQHEIDIPDIKLRLTASFGVAGCRTGTCSADELIEDANSAVQMAKNSGRNCVVRFGQFDDEARRWAELAAPGKLFERTLARDVMIPSTLVVRPDDSVAQAAALFRGAQLRVLPVVDPKGRLQGIVSPSSAAADGHQQVRDVMTSNVRSLDEETSFADLMDYCSRELSALIVIVRDGRPTGFVSPSQLATLTEPLTTASFAPAEACSTTSHYLRVADTPAVEDG